MPAPDSLSDALLHSGSMTPVYFGPVASPSFAEAEDATHVLANGTLFGQTNAASQFSDKTTNINFAAAQYFTIGIDANATGSDNFALYEVSFWYED